MLTNIAFSKDICDQSPENTLPFGQKRLTTPWPKINGLQGPVELTLKDAANATLSWDIPTSLSSVTQIEYEVKRGSNFTVLDKDEPNRIQNGIIKKRSGNYILTLAKDKNDLGIYYIRIAAQNSDGKDMALRSQPVKVMVGKIMSIAELEPIFNPFGTLIFNKKTRTYFEIDGVIHNVVKLKLESNFDGILEFKWETEQENCTEVQLNITDAKDPGTLLYSIKQVGTAEASVCKTDEGYIPCTRRKGSFDLTSIFKNLKWGKKYQLWINHLNNAGEIVGLLSKMHFLAIDYRSSYIDAVSIRGQALGPGTPEGLSLPKKIEWSRVTPHYGCMKDDHRQFTFIFTEPVNITSVKNNLSVFPPWPDVELKWHNNDTELGYGNMSNLWFDTVYTVTLGIGAKTKSGKALLETPVQWQVKTLPYAEKCPKVIAMNILPLEIQLPPKSIGATEVQFSFQTDAADYLNVFIPHLSGYWKDEKYPKLPGGVFTYMANGKNTHPSVQSFGETPFWRISLANALGWVDSQDYFVLKEMPVAKADLAILGVSWENGKFAVHLKNNGPESISALQLPYLSVSVRAIATSHGIVDGEISLDEFVSGNGDMAPGKEYSAVMKTNDTPEGVLKKEHWGNITYALLNLRKNIYVINDTNKNNDFYEKDTPF